MVYVGCAVVVGVVQAHCVVVGVASEGAWYHVSCIVVVGVV